MRLALFVLPLLLACADAPAESAAPAPTASAQDTAPARPAPAESTSPADPELVARGTFSGASGHDTAGEARLYRDDDGRYRVELSGFSTDRGPALEVWLVRRTSGDIARGGVSLGDLQSTRGDQAYAVPASVDAEAFAGISIWCERFSVNFGTASLG